MGREDQDIRPYAGGVAQLLMTTRGRFSETRHGWSGRKLTSSDKMRIQDRLAVNKSTSPKLTWATQQIQSHCSVE